MKGPQFEPYPTTRMMFVVTVVIFIIFSSRSIWDVIQTVPSMNLLVLNDVFLALCVPHLTKSAIESMIAICLLFVWWEIIPLSMVLMMFWRVLNLFI